jgi:hypothetical protein
MRFLLVWQQRGIVDLADPRLQAVRDTSLLRWSPSFLFTMHAETPAKVVAYLGFEVVQVKSKR